LAFLPAWPGYRDARYWLLATGYQLGVSNSSQQVFDLDLSGLKKTGAAKTNPSSEYFLRQLPLNQFERPGM